MSARQCQLDDGTVVARGEAQRRLTIFSGYWFPTEGGAEAQLRQVAGNLHELGWSVTVVAGSSRQERARHVDDGTSRVLRIAPNSGRSDVRASGPALLAGAFSAGLRTRPDAVISSLVSSASIAGIAVARALGRPAILRLGGDDLHRHEGSLPGRMQGRFLVRGASLIVVNASHLAAQVKFFDPKGRTPSQVIRNGVVVPGLPSRRSRTGPTTVAYYTNGGLAKNDPAFIKLVRICPDIEFRAMGRTDHLPSSPNLTRLGWVTDVATELHRADAAINTSTSERSPNFCMQALAAGRPVLGFANGGLRDLADHWPSDVLTVPIGDVDGLAEVIRGSQLRKHVVTAVMPSPDDAALAWHDALTMAVRHR